MSAIKLGWEARIAAVRLSKVVQEIKKNRKGKEKNKKNRFMATVCPLFPVRTRGPNIIPHPERSY
jgi:hypothetical protein